ncbi:hypothetical protein [Nitrosophilus kaiyonis]|uniref:hypothetical protein n=1 Tax=Nitrosophilus kaiyonis TaxID=2930200 RepID=UPI0024908881|nr:hypothetical protein [Nitrosophilus kaiyonis]
MKKITILIFLTTFLLSCPPLMDRIDIYFNKPGITTIKEQKDNLKEIANNIGFKNIDFLYENIPQLHIMLYSKKYVNKIYTSIDLSPWFKNKKCIKSWETFHECMNKKENYEDEILYRKLDQQFVSKIICQKGCDDINFVKWHLKWISPSNIALETDIDAKGDFKNIQEAKKTLAKINELLKKVVYGAKFPENYDEIKNKNETYFENSITIIDKNISKKIKNLLNYLIKQKIIKGLQKNDLKEIANLSKGGKMIFYLSKECDPKNIAPLCFSKLQFPNKKSICEKKTKTGWHSISNGNKIDFDSKKCPKIEFLK